MELTITAKIRIYPNDKQISVLKNTTNQIRKALNCVSEYIYTNNCLVQRKIHDHLYYYLRQEFNLKSQMSASAIKTAIAKYKSAKSNKHDFNLIKFQKSEYNLVWNRDYSLNKDVFSINTLQGRIHVSYETKGMEQYFDGTYKFGTAKLVNKHDKYFLHIPVTKEYVDVKLDHIDKIVGVDLGINFLATTFDSENKTTFFKGREVKHKRAKYKLLRKKLQQRQTSSARKRLFAMGQRENRWITDLNHKITKALIDQHGENTLFVLEDLTGIRQSTEKVKIQNRYVSVSWAFYQFRTMIEYKANMNKCKVLFVDPKYTSQTCPKCGHTEKSNRNKKTHTFCCKNCTYTSNDDRIGAMNLWRKGIEYISKETIGI